jgi:uncharacterized protein
MMEDKQVIISIIQREKPYLKSRFGVNQIALFGSTATGKADESSDVDILVSLSEPLGFSFIQLADYLERKIGRKVDLITASTLDIGSKDPRRAHIAKEIRGNLIYV